MPGAPVFYKYLELNGIVQLIDTDDSLSDNARSYIGNGYFITSSSSQFNLYQFVNGIESTFIKTIKSLGFLETFYGAAWDGKYVYLIYTGGIDPSPKMMKFDLNTNQNLGSMYNTDRYIAIDGDKVYGLVANAGGDILNERDFATGEILRSETLTAFANDVKDICTNDNYIYVLANGALFGTSQIGVYDKETLQPIDYWGVTLGVGLMTDGMYFYLSK